MEKITRCDCHLHTDNSFDSETPAERQVDRAHELGIEYIAITDHCDILEWSDLNIARSNAQAAELNRKYDDLTVLRGIELGEPLQSPEQTAIALGLCEYDFVLCSLHNIAGEEDFYYLHPDEEQAYDLIGRYFDELLEMVRWNAFDSLAHFTYPLRYITGRDGVRVDMSRFQPIIRRILSELAANGKAKVEHYGRMGGVIASPQDIYEALKKAEISAGKIIQLIRNWCTGEKKEKVLK